jgi:hypothetical protein
MLRYFLAQQVLPGMDKTKKKKTTIRRGRGRKTYTFDAAAQHAVSVAFTAITTGGCNSTLKLFGFGVQFSS